MAQADVREFCERRILNRGRFILLNREGRRFPLELCFTRCRVLPLFGSQRVLEAHGRVSQGRVRAIKRRPAPEGLLLLPIALGGWLVVGWSLRITWAVSVDEL